MKTNKHGLCSIAALALCATACLASDYTVDWSTTDGGGGTSTGGVYNISGSIGQPDSGSMSGGAFTLSGGFWGTVAAVQTPGAPWLTVTRTSNNTVTVWWPNTNPNWKLHWTTDPSGTSWNEIPPPYPTSGTNFLFVEPLSTGSKFFRLHKP